LHFKWILRRQNLKRMIVPYLVSLVEGLSIFRVSNYKKKKIQQTPGRIYGTNTIIS